MNVEDILRMMVEEFAKTHFTENADIVKAAIGFPKWKAGVHYKVGDVARTPDEIKQPRKCILEHDSSESWNIKTPTLWIPLHGVSPETAYPWEDPTGAQDMYQVGEYVIYNGQLYRCLQATNYNPDLWVDGWQLVDNSQDA